MPMNLLTDTIEEKLLENGRHPRQDHAPVLKVFNPCGAATWLFTELDEDGDTLFGLAALGFGFPELGSASLQGLRSIRLPFDLALERDLHFDAKYPMVCRDRHTIGYGDDGVMPATSGQVSEQARFPA